MSVHYQTLVVYGWEIGYDQYKGYTEDDGWKNVLEEEYGWRYRDEGEVAIVSDGRGGEYAYLGIVVAATNSTRRGPQSFDERLALDSTPPAEKVTELGEIKGEYDIRAPEPATHHVFTHVT